MVPCKKVLFCEAGAHGGSVKRLINLLDNIDMTKFSPSVCTYFQSSKAEELLQHRQCDRVETLGLTSFPAADVMVKRGGLPVPTFLGLRYFVCSVRMILAVRPDIIYLNNTPFCHLPMIIAAMLFGKKVICHMRDSIVLTKSEHWALKKVAQLIVLSGSHKEFYKRQGILAEKMTVIYNGIDLNGFDKAAAINVSLAKKNDCMLAFVGVLSSRKRQEDALGAIKLLLPEFPDLTVVFLGDGPDRDVLQETIKRHGLKNNALLVGMVPNVAPYLKTCKIGLMLSDREGMPNVILEYMAAGLPVVATDLPGVDEMVQEGETGIIVPVGDINKLSEALRRLLQSSQLSETMGNAGRMVLDSGRFTVASELNDLENTILNV